MFRRGLVKGAVKEVHELATARRTRKMECGGDVGERFGEQAFWEWWSWRHWKNICLERVWIECVIGIEAETCRRLGIGAWYSGRSRGGAAGLCRTSSFSRGCVHSGTWSNACFRRGAARGVPRMSWEKGSAGGTGGQQCTEEFLGKGLYRSW